MKHFLEKMVVFQMLVFLKIDLELNFLLNRLNIF